MFNAGKPVQARELTGLQSILQNQIEELSSRFFKNGDTIVNGGFDLGIPTKYVRVSSITQGSTAQEFIGSKLKGVVSGAQATVIFAESADNDSDVTFYINYIDSGVNSDQPTFVEGETLESDTENNYTATVGINATSKPIDTTPMGEGSLITVRSGTYYVNGFMVNSEKQTISLNKYDTKPTFQVGYVVDEDFVTCDEDQSLKDNAQGHSNFAAPGADRLRITLHLTKKKEDTELPNFIPIVNLLQGNIIGSPTQTVKWDWLYDLLAKRTFDESGDYLISEFPIKPMEYWNDENTDGVYDAEPDVYGETNPYPPVPGSGDRNPLSFEQADGKYALQISPGEGYVQGYNVGYVTPFYIYGDKPRQINFEDDTFTQVNPGVFVRVTNSHGLPDLTNIMQNHGNINAFTSIVAYRNFIDGHVGTGIKRIDYPSSERNNQTERYPQNSGNKPWKTFHTILTDAITIQSSGDRPEVEVVTQTGETYQAIVIYPNRYTGIVEGNEGYLLTDPDGLKLACDGGSFEGARFVFKNDDETVFGTNSTNSFVINVLGAPDDFEIARGDEIRYETQSERVLISQKIEAIKSGIIKPKYYQSSTLVNTQNGFFGFNSVYDMGLLQSEFFTELAVFDRTSYRGTQFPQEWLIGERIVGEKSGASAKLEQAREGFLVVSNIQGTFVNGENIVQTQGQVDVSPESFILSTDPDGKNITSHTGDRLVIDDEDNPLFNPSLKIGQIAREGEIIDLHFNSYSGESGPLGDGGGGDKFIADNAINDWFNSQNGSNGGGDGGAGINPGAKRIFTDVVELTHPTVKSALRDGSIDLPSEIGQSTQEAANLWFYEAIKSIKFNEQQQNKVTISMKAPDNPSKNDLWITEDDYTLYAFDGNFWIAVTEQDPYFTPEADFTFSNVRTAATSAAFDVIDERVAPPVNNLSLSSYNTLIVYGVGSVLELPKDGGENWYHDQNKNKIVLTDKGRNAIYKNAFFNPEQSVTSPRINYELFLVKNDGGQYEAKKGIRGYAVTVPSKITNTIKKTKSFYSELVDDNNYSADAALDTTSGSDVSDISGGSTFSGLARYNFVSADNFVTDSSEELVAGDVVVFTDDNFRTQYKLVSFVTKPFGYGENRTRCTVYFTTTLEGDITGKPISRVRLKSYGSKSESLIYQLPKSVVQTIETNPNDTNIEYKAYRQFITTIDELENTIELVADTNQVFLSNPLKIAVTITELAEDNNSSTADDREKYEGRILALDKIVPIELDDAGKKIRIKLDQRIDKKCNLKVIAPVEILNAKSRRKFLKRDGVVEIPTKITRTLSNGKEVTFFPSNETIIQIKDENNKGYTDIYKLLSVKTKDAEGDYTVDITDNYLLDDGQRDTYYGVGMIVRESFAPTPDNDIEIRFEYFEHDTSVDGDFFSVDSYTHSAGVPYGEIPVFKPSNLPSENNMVSDMQNISIKLRDCVDFRPAVNVDGEDPSLHPYVDTRQEGTEKSLNYKGKRFGMGNATVPKIPVPRTQFKCDISYYLPKIDSLFLDKTGKMILKSGQPAESPTAPEDISTGIRLYDLHMPAYTFDVKDIVTRKYNYRRYTMKDIYDIDRRVERVEKLVVLSLLEQSAMNTSVRDAVTGMDRFKNGVVVDPFKDHSKGDVGNEQYRCSIDPKLDHLRVPYFIDQVLLEERNVTDDQRGVFGNYKSNNNIITCGFKPVDFIRQPAATRAVKIQDISVSSYEGKITMSPSFDTFYDNKTKSDLVIETNAVYSALTNLTQEQVEANLGTVWGQWETNGRLPNKKVNTNGRERSNFTIDAKTIKDGVSLNTLTINTNQSSLQEHKVQMGTGFDIATGSVVSTAFGDRLIDIQITNRMRSIPVYIKAEGLKPNTKHYAFFDDIPVNAWFCVDKINTDFVDNINRYDGTPNSDPLGFNQPLISDGAGSLQGVFIIPNGRRPVTGSIFNGSMDDIEYDTTGTTRHFATGQTTFKLSSNSRIDANITDIQAYASSEFVSRAVIHDKSDSIVSTRLAQYTTNRTLSEDVRFNFDGESSSDYDPSGVPSPIPSTFDPIAQTFIIDRNNPDGVFVTDLDVFFKKKDQFRGAEVYLVTTEGNVPTSKVVPHSRVYKDSDTTLRVSCELINNLNATTIEEGVRVRGGTSGATGIVKSNIKFESKSSNNTRNVTNTVYNLILNNYDGIFLPGEELIPETNPVNKNTFMIVEDELEITRVDLNTLGSKYTQGDYVIEFDEPHLPGGEIATATLSVAENLDGVIYDVKLTSSGSGYIKQPGVQIVLKEGSTGKGDKCTLTARMRGGRKSVNMGVATSDDAKSATKFVFDAPVYLLGNKTYAFIVKSPASTQYELWTAKIGDVKIGTSHKVITQPNTGVMFVSQNQGVWTENQDTDITFHLNRASFDTNVVSEVIFDNPPLDLQKLKSNPIEIKIPLINDPESMYFGDNSDIIRIHQYNHGFMSGDYVMVDGVTSDNILTSDQADRLNGLHEVVAVNLNTFTIKVDNFTVDRSGRYGGMSVMCSCNRVFEAVNMYSGLMSFESTNITVGNRAAFYGGLPTIDKNTDPLVSDFVGYNESEAYKLDTTTSKSTLIPLMDTHYYSKSRVVANNIIEAQYSDDDHLRKGKSMETRVYMTTKSDKVSPVVDVDRTNMNLVKNMVDKQHKYFSTTEKPSGIIYWDSNERNTKFEDVFRFTDKNGVKRTIKVDEVDGSMRRIRVSGKDLVQMRSAISFDSLPRDANNVEFYVTQSPSYKPETTNEGSNYAKYVSRMFSFDSQCDGIEMRLTGVLYDISDIKVYYKLKTVGFDGDFSSLNWTPFNINQSKPDETEYDYGESIGYNKNDTTSAFESGSQLLRKTPGLADNVELIKTRDVSNVDPRFIMPEDWQELVFSAQDLQKFDACAVKIVMTADNPARSPIIDDYSLIVSE